MFRGLLRGECIFWAMTVSILFPFVALLSVLAGITDEIGCDEVEHKVQKQPVPYKESPSEQAYIRHERALVGLNDQIPPLCVPSLRVLTFNIHYHLDIYDEEGNTASLKRDLGKLQPTVAIFQEVLHDEKDARRRQFDGMLEELGFHYRMMTPYVGGRVGNMVASRMPIRHVGHCYLGLCRALLAIKLEYRSYSLVILATHLEVSSSMVRQRQTRTILEFVRKLDLGKERLILGGDLNSERGSIEMNSLMTYFADSFGRLRAPPPKMTFWDGRALDYLMINDKVHLYGSYVYHTTTSDHIPVIIDVKLD